MESKLIPPAVIYRKFLTVCRLLTTTIILGVTLSVAHAAEGDDIASKRLVKDRETQRAVFGKSAEIANRAKPGGSGTGDAIAPRRSGAWHREKRHPARHGDCQTLSHQFQGHPPSAGQMPTLRHFASYTKTGAA
jgi:hypothetical protein